MLVGQCDDDNMTEGVNPRCIYCKELEMALSSEEDGPSVNSTMPREGMEEEACEVSAEFSCEEEEEE